jgi:hypothetical protein
MASQCAGLAGVPASASGVLYNLTAAGYGTKEWLTAHPAGGAAPDTSTLNFDTSQYAIANGAIVGGGQLCVNVGTVDSAPGSSQVIIDIAGYLP